MSELLDPMKNPVTYAVPFFLLTIGIELAALKWLDHDDNVTGYLRKDAQTSLLMGLGSLVLPDRLQGRHLLHLHGDLRARRAVATAHRCLVVLGRADPRDSTWPTTSSTGSSIACASAGPRTRRTTPRSS